MFQAWRLPNQGRNNVANRYGREGIYVTHPSRAFRDEEGKSFFVEIEIVDNYRYPSGHQGPYHVTVSSHPNYFRSLILLSSTQFISFFPSFSCCEIIRLPCLSLAITKEREQ